MKHLLEVDDTELQMIDAALERTRPFEDLSAELSAAGADLRLKMKSEIGKLTGTATAAGPREVTPPSDLVDRIANLAMNGVYEPGQYTRRGGLSAGLLHNDGQGGAWFYIETTQNNTERERVRVTVTPA